MSGWRSLVLNGSKARRSRRTDNPRTCLVATRQPVLSRVVPLPAAIEVKHLQRVVGPRPEWHRIAGCQRRHCGHLTRSPTWNGVSFMLPIMCNPQDSSGHAAIQRVQFGTDDHPQTVVQMGECQRNSQLDPCVRRATQPKSARSQSRLRKTLHGDVRHAERPLGRRFKTTGRRSRGSTSYRPVC